MTPPIATWFRRRLGPVAVAATALLVLAGCSDSGTDTTTSTTSGSATVGSDAPLDPALSQRLDVAIESAMEQASIPGAIVGVWSPEGAYVTAHGVADKATGAPMETDFYSRIGSVTKTFTVTGILQLVDEGTVGLDDPIDKYIPGVPGGDRITIRELARMQSGLANYTASEDFQKAFFADPNAPFTPEKLLGYAFALPTSFPPGEGFEYSNTNTTLLGLVVEKVSGMSLPDYITEKILAPLELDDTSFPTDAAFPEPHAQGYTTQTLDGNEATATDWNPSWGWAAGAMISTLDDLRIWAPALANGTLLTPETQAQRLETVTAPGYAPGVGYGLGIFDVEGWIGHNGSLPGYQTVVVHLPEKEMTLVIMINTDEAYEGSEPSTLLANAITQVITPDHVYRLADKAPTSGPPAVPATPVPPAATTMQVPPAVPTTHVPPPMTTMPVTPAATTMVPTPTG
ncbi:Penicillin-binding protein [Rhodococcus sp. RD6.2]|jgi:D-alanyl-D-alanine carboxypeptidase|uniref:serine hydrolase domain-containing protein n=1 Tax=Rhodococcus sp. RD6.2 TaxID=260936 RepID=UPI00063B2099|nr:serine hydrolase domain-containing protein [Rhodococcus sp. RD6.2]CRK50380.1 Penicillin-binding protein [Rhodococcus sp. RD6.2]